MPVYLRNATRKAPLDVAGIERTVRALLTAIGEDESSVSVFFVGDAAMRRLNRTHRGKDAATDVLSFPIAGGERFDGAERLLGDVVISVDTARRQAAGYDATLEREIERLLIHGMLHLVGHDHLKAEERARMEREERRLAAAIDMPWPY